MLLPELHLKCDIMNECCDRISLVNSEDIVWLSKKDTDIKKLESILYAIKIVPKYLNVQFYNDKRFSVKKYSSIKGFAINLDGYSDIDNYLTYQFRRKAKGNILRSIRRLEKSYNIKYKRYFGKADKAEVDSLMILLKKMILKRFQQRHQKNDALNRWEDIQSTIYDLIINKKASLFVIYHNKKALAISLGYHFNLVIFYYIASYDVDYSKFGLGNIMIYKQLEWCITNDYRYFDMGWGYLDYKRRWCNYIHIYDNHLIFSNTSIIVYLMSIWEGNKTRLRAYLLSSKLKTFFDKTKKLLIVKSNNNSNYNFQNLDYSISLEGLVQLDLKNEKNFHFGVIKNDFIYYTEEYYSDVKLYSGPKQEFFIIKGKKHCKKIVFEE